MKHQISVHSDVPHINTPALTAHIKRCIRGALEQEGITVPCEINVLLTDNEGIRQLNRELRDVDRATDVLSFPMFELEPGVPPEDEDYLDAVQNIIDTQKVNAEYAVAVTGDNFARCLRRWRTNICAGARRMLKTFRSGLCAFCPEGAGQGIHTDEPVIILADDLAPSETVQLERTRCYPL